MNNKQTLHPYMKQFYRGNGWRFAIAILQTVVMTGASVMISWLIQQIIDMATGIDIGFTFPQIVALTIIGALLEASAYALSYVSKPKFIARGIGQYQEYVFSRMCKKGIAAFSGENTTLYLSALSNDATSIELNYLANIFIIVDNVVLCIGALCLMFYYSPLLTLVSIGLSILPLIASVCTGNLVAKAEKRVSDKNETYMTTLKDCLAGFSVIKSFRAEAQMCKLLADKIDETTKAKTLRRKMSYLVNMFAACSGTIVQFGVFLFGAYLSVTGSALSAGAVLVFVQLLNFVINPIGVIPQALAECKAAKALVAKTAAALNENVRDNGAEQKKKLHSSIKIEHLSFGYEEDKPVLQDVGFTFEIGKSYAIVGTSGSGKSTLLNLLMASHEGYDGSILYDDVNIRDIRSDALYEMISVIQQNVFIFNASIRDNITMFSSFPNNEVERAIQLSGLSDLIAARGEDYLCGENGSSLSGGEKQRISIARSLLKKSQVLLVDEATAALDAQTADQVSNAILDLKDITRIVITHSMDASLLKRYDCILTMKNGTLSECGSFDKLMEQKGYFYSLYTISQ